MLIKRLQKKCVAIISLFLYDFDLVIYAVQVVLLHFILKLLYFNHHFFIFVVNLSDFLNDFWFDCYDFLLFFLYWACSKEIVVGVTLQHVIKWTWNWQSHWGPIVINWRVWSSIVLWFLSLLGCNESSSSFHIFHALLLRVDWYALLSVCFLRYDVINLFLWPLLLKLRNLILKEIILRFLKFLKLLSLTIELLSFPFNDHVIVKFEIVVHSLNEMQAFAPENMRAAIVHLHQVLSFVVFDDSFFIALHMLVRLTHGQLWPNMNLTLWIIQSSKPILVLIWRL